MAQDCGVVDLICQGKNAAAGLVDDTIANMAKSVLDASTKAISSLGTMWVHIGTPNLTGTGGGSSLSPGSSAPYSSNITVVLGYVMWISLAVAALSLIGLGTLLAVRMRAGDGIASVGKLGLVLGAVVLISSAGALVGGLAPSGPAAAGGAVLFLQSGLWWYMLVAAVVSVILGGVRMAWEQRAEPGRETVKSLLTLLVVAGSGVTIVGLLVSAADAFAVWIINSSLDCNVEANGTCFGRNMSALLALTSGPATGGLGPLLIIIFGLIAILASAFQIVLMVARGGMLVVLTGILPLSASFTNTEMGRGWFKRCVAWLVAFILYKPAAAIVYAAAFQLVGTNVFTDDGSGFLAVLTGLMLMIIALFAMPALMRFVTPMVGAMAGGAGGSMAAGAVAALPTGAMSLGRLGTGGGAPAASASSGASGSSGSQGPSGGTGPTGGGGGAWSSPSGQDGSQNGSQNGASGASNGAAAAAPATRGGAAASAGGAAAAGATGGASLALEGARQAGQAVAGAAHGAAEHSTGDTGEGSGPHGSR